VTQDEVVTGDYVTQDVTNKYWLDRLDERNLPLDGEYKYELDGTGVKIYIFDSGIRTSHKEFGGRASCGFNVFGTQPCEDTVSGHGTHTSGCAAGVTVGVAKNATLIAVRVLDNKATGSVTGIIAGIEYVANEKRNNPSQPMVVNMSL
jgi:subtilisin family serine protease